MTIEIAAADIKDRIEEALARVEAGETVLVKRDARTVAELSPAQTDGSAIDIAERWREVRSEIAAMRAEGVLKPVTIEEILAWRHEDHRH
jgi:antitoxin (DNA-binding transcriptional repressor) of toxin-antitoxin stability system